MTMRMNVEMSIVDKPKPKIKLPATVMKLQTTVTRVDSNGDIHYQFSYSDADVVDDPTVSPQVLKAMRAQIKKIVGASGSCIVDNRGQTKAYTFVLPEGLDQNIKQMLAQISNSPEQLSSPVPQQAIGIGAKWRVSSSPNLGGIQLNRITTYQLINLQNNIATLKVDSEQHATPQDLTRPGLPAGTTLTLKSLNSQGQGQVIMGLKRLLPIHSKVSMHSDNEINANYAGHVATISTKLFMDIALNSK